MPTTASSTSVTPSPVLAEAWMTAPGSMSKRELISSFTLSGSAVERSTYTDRIEFIIGNATGTFINYLVEDRDDDEIVCEGKVEIGDCLSLHPLVGVDEQDDALARQQRAGHLRAEVDVTRRVDQVQEILLSW